MKLLNSRRRLLATVLTLIVAYPLAGLAFHFKWRNEIHECYRGRAGDDQILEREVFDEGITLTLDVLFWPVYSTANLIDAGTPFATRCS